MAISRWSKLAVSQSSIKQVEEALEDRDKSSSTHSVKGINLCVPLLVYDLDINLTPQGIETLKVPGFPEKDL